MQLKAQRMQRYEKHGKFYCQNLIFKNDAKKIIQRDWKRKSNSK